LARQITIVFGIDRCFVDIFWPFKPLTEHPHKLPNLIVKERVDFSFDRDGRLSTALSVVVNN